MSHFYGKIEGNAKTPATREGTKNSGLVTIAAGWQGAIRVILNEEKGKDYYEISLAPWKGSPGGVKQLAKGVLDAAEN